MTEIIHTDYIVEYKTTGSYIKGLDTYNSFLPAISETTDSPRKARKFSIKSATEMAKYFVEYKGVHAKPLKVDTIMHVGDLENENEIK